MSILIRGMEIPTSCGQCPLHDEDYRGIEHCDIGWKKIGKAEEKPDWCPLRPVPPHGRLIDADALIDAIIVKYIRHERNRELVFAVAEIKQDLADIINELPTIIPASEEGET